MDTLQFTESPFYHNLSGNASQREIMGEVKRLYGQQHGIRVELSKVRDQKEALGAEIIRCKSRGVDCGELEYDLNNMVSEYYRLQQADRLLGEEIKVLQDRAKSVRNASGTTGNTSPLGSESVDPLGGKNTAPAPEPFHNAIPALDKNKVMIFGKEYTYGEIIGFAVTLLTVSFALAFPLKQPSKIE